MDGGSGGGAPPAAETGSGTSSPRWFAVHTHPNQEAVALTHLTKQGFRAWLPERLKTVRHARRASVRKTPLFPRYLFVQFDPATTRWRKIDSTIGVTRLVAFGDGPMPVPEGVVEGLLAMRDADGVIQLGGYIAEGGQVRLAAGPFAEMLGTLERFDGADAVRVLLSILGREVAVRAPRGQVLPAG